MARMKKLISDKTKNRFRHSITGVINGLSREVVVYLPSHKTECPNCYYDVVHQKSSGIPRVDITSPTYFTVGRCPVCLGQGVITTARKTCITGVVNWNPSGENLNSMEHSEAGKDGATTIEVKTNPCHLEIVKTAEYFIIDGVKCHLFKPPIIRGLGEQVVMSVILYTSFKPLLDSNEKVRR